MTRNVLSHHAGGININGCRVGGEQGRWPANLLIQHRPGCQRVGIVEASGYIINRWTDGAKPFGGGAGHAYDTEVIPPQTIEDWSCVPGCAALALGSQGTFVPPESATMYFKQVQPMTPKEIPADLWEYMTKLIAPPAGCNPVILAHTNLGAVDFSQIEDHSVHGVITVGDPTAWMAEVDRVLRPGGHMLVVSDEHDPTGATGACAVEDFGYEIRDAIALLDEEGDFTYAPKASSRERNAGVTPREKTTPTQRLFPREGEDIDDLREDLAEMMDLKLLKRMKKDGLPVEEVPEDMMDRFELRESVIRRVVQSDHPTVKSRKIMGALLEDLPKSSLVVDPTMGSGTTALECMVAGHSFIGIEQDAEYFSIAEERANYWGRRHRSWCSPKITVDGTGTMVEAPLTGGFFDLMGDEE